jgi:hypothetical protein
MKTNKMLIYLILLIIFTQNIMSPHKKTITLYNGNQSLYKEDLNILRVTWSDGRVIRNLSTLINGQIHNECGFEKRSVGYNFLGCMDMGKTKVAFKEKNGKYGHEKTKFAFKEKMKNEYSFFFLFRGIFYFYILFIYIRGCMFILKHQNALQTHNLQGLQGF